MRILIIGASGQLGQALVKTLRENHELLTPSSAELDLGNPAISGQIVALRPGEEDGLTARVAPADAFAAAGIEPSAVLNSMRFAVERRGAQRILRVTTTQPVNEPFVELLVELQ